MLGGGAVESHCYHVMSRTCGGDVFFDDVEKEALRRLLWKMSEFCGVRVLTYCVMGNHFHALVEVPKREIWLERFSGAGGEERLFAHLRTLYSRAFVGMLREQIAEWRRQGHEVLVQAKLEGIKRRFCDLSLFVKEVKERFSRWINKRRSRKGTLWMDRFKSVLVEGRGDPLRTMAAYIDLNAVRGGLVEDPKDYRWCGYAEAVSGSRRAQRGLNRAMGRQRVAQSTESAARSVEGSEVRRERGARGDEADEGHKTDRATGQLGHLARSAEERESEGSEQEAWRMEASAWERTEMEGWEKTGAAESYRCLLYASGVEVKDAQQVNVVRRGVTAERAREVLAVKGKLSAAELIRLRVRYFSDGVALGSREFVEGVFAQHRDSFGPKRKDGARPLAEIDSGFFTLRKLRLRAIG